MSQSLLLFLAVYVAQTPESWVGKRVITHYGAVLKVKGQIEDDAGRGKSLQRGKDRSDHRIYRVEQTNGKWLWLVEEKGSARGWITAEWLIPFDQAIEYFTKQMREQPSSSTYHWRGVIWSDKKEYDIAIADYKEAIRLDPQNESAFISRGLAWKNKKEFDKAIADFNEAIRLDPQDTTAFNNRGTAWLGKQEYDKAIADFNEAIRLDPQDAFAFNNRGIAWNDKEEYNKALADFNEAIRLDPQNATVFVNRGIAWRGKEEFDKALADDNEAIRLDPQNARAFMNRGIALAMKKEYDKALADFNEAIRLDPQYASAFNNRAWLMATCPDARVRDGKRAVESANRACELNGSKSPFHLGTLAASYAEEGDFAKAVEWQTKAIELLILKDEKRKQDFQSRLELYKANKPCRDPE